MISKSSSRYFAHSDKSGLTDLLRCHLELVAQRAAQYASASDLGPEAYVAGLLHDLGKYGDLFQRRLQGKESGIDHWSAGACESLSKYQAKGIAPALAIQGHHIGLQNGDKDSIRGIDLSKLAATHPLGLRLSEPDLKNLLSRFGADGFALQSPDTLEYSWTPKLPVATMLDVRMLYSALVDADFIETEAYFDAVNEQRNYRQSGPPLESQPALELLTSYLSDLAARSTASPTVNRLRADLLQACLEKADLPQGLFTLTAPTGTGKTLAMLAFSLKHAVNHDLRRIVIVIPYLSIIEQSVRQYRDVFKSFPQDISLYIVEDHSLAGIHSKEDNEKDRDNDLDDESSYARELVAQNWDAPVIVTTSVQFLESLFANRPFACRKLHRLAQSIVLFDEVQTLPTSLAIPTLAALSHLAKRYGTTIVLATATQPAFQDFNEHVKVHCGNGWAPSEIVPPQLHLFPRAKRTAIEWPRTDQVVSWEEMANVLRCYPQALCIVNLKRHALALYEELSQYGDSDLFHLSTNMCPAHRLKALEEVRRRLDSGQPCRLVSTQCIEAGVDIDFPVVFRALGPLDAIAQAAGRCNRRGLAESGKVCVFVPEDDGYPDRTYKQATGVTRILLQELGVKGMDINCPDLYDKYYSKLYRVNQPENAKPELTNAINRQDFVEVAQQYRLIEKNTINVLVPYDQTIFQQLKNEAKAGLKREWIARARPYTVGLFRPFSTDPVVPYLYPVLLTAKMKSEDWFIYLEEKHYDVKKRGLVLPKSSECLIA